MTWLRKAERRRWIVGGLAGGMLAVALSGCAVLWRGKGAATLAPRSRERMREATRGELLAALQKDMGALATLKAKASVSVVRYDVLVPATLQDEVRRRRGKPYRKKHDRAHLTGMLLLARGPYGSRKIKFWGEVIGPSTSFMLLGRDDEFWIALPNMDREGRGRDVPRGRAFIGRVDRQAIRTKDLFSMRPQDIGDLLLCDEAFAAEQGEVICYMETWEGFYVLNFLRPDWREHVFAKIWISRRDLRMAIHQIFDGSGAIVAEGRFGDYRRLRARGRGVEVLIPRQWVLLWPRDSLVMEVTLANERVNEKIDEKHFEPKMPRGYEVERLEMPKRSTE